MTNKDTGVDLDAMFDDADKLQKEKERIDREMKARRTGRLRPHEGKENAFFLVPPHPNMNRMPYRMRGTHNKIGPSKKRTMTCLRDEPEQPVNKCPQCQENLAFFQSGSKAKIDIAKQRNRRQKFIWGAIDMSSFVGKDGMPLPEKDMKDPPDCFGNYIGDENAKGYQRCKKCVAARGTWGRTCMNGVCSFMMGQQLFVPTKNAFKLNGDMTAFNNAHIALITQEGEDGKGRENYTIVGWVRFNFPTVVKKWITKNLVDLNNIFPPRSPEEMKATMEGVEYVEDLDDSDLPACYADQEVFDESSEKCKECDAFEMCKAEIEAGTGTESEADEKTEEAAEEEVGEPEEGAEEEGGEEEEEEEEEELEEETDKFDEMDRRQLKLYNVKQELKVRVVTSMSDDELRDALREAEDQTEAEEEAEEEAKEEEYSEEDDQATDLEEEIKRLANQRKKK
jgi:hypothetical protein